MAASITHHVLDLPKVPADKKVLIVRAPYYKDIVDDLTKGAQATLDAAGAGHEVLDVPGALEIPPAVSIAGGLDQFDAFVALGCVIRGETTHYETVCNDSSNGLMLLGLRGFAIGNGILTVENAEQARVRANPDGQNKGGDAAAAAVHLMMLAEKLVPRKRFGFAPDSEHIIVAGKD